MAIVVSGREFARMVGIKKENKYGAKKTTVDGIVFDSRLEASRWSELRNLEKAGVIKNLERQKEFVLIDKSEYGRKVVYKADFVYETKEGKMVVEDTKSAATKTGVYKLKKRMVAERYGIIIKEITSKSR